MRAHICTAVLTACTLCLLAGCRPESYRKDADETAYNIIQETQKQTLGRTEAFTVERPADTLRRRLLLDQGLPHAGAASLGSGSLEHVPYWPKDRPLSLTLAQALQVAARNNRDYQTRKESVFQSALALDLQANEFRSLLFAGLESEYTEDRTSGDPVRGVANTGTATAERQFKNGTALTTGFAVDLAKLLTADRSSSLGLLADATITVPLLRGSGRHIVTEPLTQAERDVVYSLFTFERFKRTLAVRVASEYLSVLQQLDQVSNAENNYRQLIASTQRARQLAEAGRLPQIQVDQALQDELRARDRWVSAQQSYASRLDAFKITLGLPTDANIDLDREELTRLVASIEQFRKTNDDQNDATPSDTSGSAADKPVELTPPKLEGGGLEMAAGKAVDIALKNRLDLQSALGRVCDAQRGVVVAADALGAELTLFGSAAVGERRGIGSADSPDAQLRLSRGLYGLGMTLDLPLERTAERNAYRNSLIALEAAVRSAQELEDQVKLDVRDSLRGLLQARESHQIQAQAVTVAKRRVESTELFLQAGRAEIRDVLEAQEALISAQNALTAALVSYRVAELQLQSDMDVLQVDEKGNWREYEPEDTTEK